MPDSPITVDDVKRRLASRPITREQVQARLASRKTAAPGGGTATAKEQADAMLSDPGLAVFEGGQAAGAPDPVTQPTAAGAPSFQDRLLEREAPEIVSEFTRRWARAGLDPQRFREMYDPRNPKDVRLMAEMNRSGKETDDFKYELAKADLRFREYVAAPLKGMTGGLVDAARAGGGEMQERFRQEAGMGDRLVSGGLEMAGAALPIGGATRGLQAVGMGRAAAPAALGLYSAGQEAVAGGDVGDVLAAGGKGAAVGAIAGPLHRGLAPAGSGVARELGAGGLSLAGASTVVKAATGEEVTGEGAAEELILGTALAALGLPAGARARRIEAFRKMRPEARKNVLERYARIQEAEIPKINEDVARQRADMGLAEAGRVKQEAVDRGLAKPEEAFSKAALADGERAAAEGKDPIAAIEAREPAPAKEGGTDKGYQPTEQAIAEGNVAPEAVDLVRAFERKGGKAAASGVTDGEPYVIGKDAKGETVVERGQPEVVEMGSMSPLKAPAEKVAEFLRRIPSGLRSMIERARRGGSTGKGGAAAAEVAQKAQKAADEMRATKGEWADAYRAEQQTAGVSPFGGMGRARSRLTTPVAEPGRPTAGVAPIVEIMEGRAEIQSPAEGRIIDGRRGLVRARGATFERDHLKVQDRPVEHGGTGKMVDFKNHDGVDPRVPAPLLQEVMARPDHPLRQQIVGDFAAVAKMPEAEVRSIFEEMAKEYGETGGSATDKTTQAEHRRFFPRVPTHTRVGNRWEPLYEVRPGHYGRALYEGGSARVGFYRAFGQNFALTDKGDLLRDQGGQPVRPIDQLQERYGKETGREDVAAETLRAASGRPIEAKPVTSAAQDQLGTFGRSVMGLWKAGKLSATALYNALESGLRAPEVGVINTARAWGEGVAAGLQRLSGGRLGRGIRERFVALERQGAIDVSTRVSTHGFVQGVNARSAQLFSEQMQRRASKPDKIAAGRDAGRLRGMGYDAATAKRMSEGRGTPTEYRDFVNRAVPRTTGNRISQQEMGRGEHVRILKMAFPIMRFAMRQLGIVGNAGKAFAATLRNPKDWRSAGHSARHLGETLGTHGAVGTAQYLIHALAYGGGAGLAAAIARWSDDPEEAFAHGFTSNSLGGPVGTMMAAVRGDRDIASAIAPVSLAREASEILEGSGRYKDQTWAERAQTFTKGAIPALRVAETAYVGAASMFAGEPDREQEWRVALQTLRAWHRDAKIPDTAFMRRNPSESDERFTSGMRKAYRAILADAEPDKVLGFITEALGAEGKDADNFKASIQARLALEQLTPEQRAALKSFAGERAYANLEAHDALLKAMLPTGKRAPVNKPKEKRDPVNIERVERALGK